MRSAMALRDVVRRRLRGARSSLSRTTSDFEILRPRDSASMSATKGSGNRTVRVFMKSAYYLSDSSARQTAEPADSDIVSVRSEEHTSELQSLTNLVCRLLLEKKKNK